MIIKCHSAIITNIDVVSWNLFAVRGGNTCRFSVNNWQNGNVIQPMLITRNCVTVKEDNYVASAQRNP